MRVWLISVLAMVFGAATGLTVTWLEFHGVREYFQPESRSKAGQPADSSSPSGPLAVVVGGTKFDFGTLNYDQSREKTFVIRNDGNEPLEISWNAEGVSCGKCIQNTHNFTHATVPPAGTCEVIVTYATRKAVTQFSESATLTTNDPRNNALQLNITGFVTMALKLEPESLALTSISTSEPTSVSVKLFGFQSDKLELVKHELSNPSSSTKIELTSKPLDAAAISAENHALAGLELQFQINPGLPIGPFAQTISLTVKTDGEHTIELPISGTVVGDLSVYGKSFDSGSGTLSMGIVNRDVGFSCELFVLAKGPSRNDVKLSVGEIDPSDVLQVTIGEPVALADGKAIKFPINFAIPKGTPAMNRLGNLQGKAAKLVLETTHPVSKQLPIKVRFAVE